MFKEESLQVLMAFAAFCIIPIAKPCGLKVLFE